MVSGLNVHGSLDNFSASINNMFIMNILQKAFDNQLVALCPNVFSGVRKWFRCGG
jgi:hypothetical protein